MKLFFSFLLLSTSAMAAEVCTFKGKSTWEKKTGLVKCTNFRGIPVKEFQIRKGRQDGLQRSFHEGELTGIAWFESSQREPMMEITFNDYGEVALITCGKRAYTKEDAKYCGFKGKSELSFKNFKGELAKKAVYLNGEIVQLTTYFSSGKVKEEMKVLGDQKKTTVFHEDGTKSAEAVEIAKIPVWEKEYYTGEKLKSESSYTKEGEDLFIVRKQYYKNGVLKEEGKLQAATTWSKEYYVGELKKYHENGQLSSSEVYDKKGDLEGLSTFFDDDGDIVLKKKFSNNKLIKEERL